MSLKLKRKPKVIKTYRQSVPATRFIGIKYGDGDRVDGGFGKQWDEWHEKGRFKLLEDACPKADFEDSTAYIGLMRWKETEIDGEKIEEPFQYWIGMFFPESAEVPEGFGYVDFPESDLGVAWLYGKGDSVFFNEGRAVGSCEKNGMKVIPDEEGAYWFFERYTCPRFTTPDKKGKIILDICHYAEKGNDGKKTDK
ncbi:MAG: hypothetical protein FWF08_00310 [Oscillospiraceae bacterium]|nr:hypothetical protein [Oscillospiraceae bacterium]